MRRCALTKLYEVKEGKVVEKAEMLKKCQESKCRGVFHYREPPFKCYIPIEELPRVLKGF